MTCLANPTGGIVVDGSAIIQNRGHGLTTIMQSTDRAVIDWQSFSINAGERTNFIVPGATSATLNRVLGCDPSILNGTLTSNGHLFLINSNGIVFGQGARVDVAGLTASTLNIDNCMFMSGGEMVFSGSSQAAVKNAGVIKASSGDVFLIGYQVSNSGTIRAPNGTVGLAAGSEVLIKPVGDERVVVRTASGSRKKYGVSNSGVIEANVAELKAHGGNVYALAIRNTGRVAATGVNVQGGRILLSANGGKIENSGRLVARGTSGNGGQITVNAGKRGSVDINGHVDAGGPTGAGGKIAITGEKVEVRRAIAVTAEGKTAGGEIDIGSVASAGTSEAYKSSTFIAGIVSASSSQGTGGEVRLGGSSLTIQDCAVISADGFTGGGRVYAGGGWSPTASSVLDSTCVAVECDVLLTANALGNGNGGKVVVTASSDLAFWGSLQARGGTISGDGGQAELSAGSKVSIDRLSGRVDLGAANGGAGSLLVQSSAWEISDRCGWMTNVNALDDDDISNFLNSANLAVQAVFRNPGDSGRVVLSGVVTWCAANSLTISTDCDFLMTSGGVIDALGGGDITINAGRFVSLETGTSLRTGGSNVLINANQQVSSVAGQAGITLGGDVTTGGGNVSLAGVGVASTGGSVDAGGGTILVDGNDGAINLTGSLTTSNATAAAVRIIDATSVILGNVTTGASGTVVLGEAGGDNLNGTVTQIGIINAGTLTGNTGGAVNLGGNNRVDNLGAFTVTGAFTFNDAADGLNITVSLETQGGAVTISTAGGVLALGSNNITTNGGNVSLTGGGVTGAGGSVNAGGGTILIDGNDEALNFAGALTTSNDTAAAVRIIDATTAVLGNITTGAAGTVTLGETGADNLSGAVTQTGAINAGTVSGNGGSTVTLDGNNTVVNLGGMTSSGAFLFNDTTGGLNVTGNIVTQGGSATISATGGTLALGSSNIATNGGNVSLSGSGVTSTGSAVDAGAGTILVDGNDGAISLAGELKTSNDTATAVRIIDATMAILGNITTGAAGTVTLGAAGGDNLNGAVTQTGTINAGTLSVNSGGTVTLDGNNTVANLGTVTSAGALVFKDTTGGLNMTGNVMTQGASATVSTAGGALALGSNSITTNGGNVSLTGEGVSSTGGVVDAGGGMISVDANDGAINLAGELKTTNETAKAVRIVDATTASLGNITTGAAGTVTLGEAGGDNLSGAVTQTGAINTGTLAGNGGSTVTLDGNNTVVNLGEMTSAEAFVFKDTTGGLNVTGDVMAQGGATISTAGGALVLGNSNVTTNSNVSLTGNGVTSAGGKVDAGGGTISVDGNDGAISLAGELKTTNETVKAVRIVDATTATLGNVTTGAAGMVTLGEAGGDNLRGAVKQTGAINAGTVTGNGGSTVTLDGNNTVVNLGEMTSADAFVFKDTAGGLNVTGNVTTQGAATVSTAGGALALGSNSITTNGGNVSLTGQGVTSTGGKVDAGAGTIAVDGNDGAINLAGELKTTNGTATAVRVVDATNATLGNITTGAAGTVALGEAGGDGLSGAVAVNGSVTTANLVMAGDSDFTLANPANAISTVATNGPVHSVMLADSTTLTVGKVGAATGLSAVGDIRVSTTAAAGMMVGQNVTSQEGTIALSSSNITVNGATISSTGSASVTLTSGQFTLTNQPNIKGVLVGTGTTAQLSLNDSNLTLGENYTVDAATITAGTRVYNFQNVSVLRFDLGSGDDKSNTNFFSFSQFLYAGLGANKLFVNGTEPTSSPLTKPGFGTITFSNFATAPPQTIPLDGTPFGSVVLQNAQPGAGPGGSTGSQTNNFNITSVGGASGILGGAGVAAATGGLLANVTSTMGDNLGFASAGGGAPPSLRAQSQLNSSSSAAVESELNAALGGDGRMGVRSSTGLVSVDPQGPPPAAGTVAKLESGMGLQALSELSLGVFGVSQVTVNNQWGAQPIDVGGILPASATRQKLAQSASPELYSQLSMILGGDGTARVEDVSGTIATDLKSLTLIPPAAQARLLSLMSFGSLGELALALGGTGELVVNDSHGLVSLDASGAPVGRGVAPAMLVVLAAPGMSQMSAMLGGDGRALLTADDGIQSTAFDGTLPGPFVKLRLSEATSPTSVEELDHAIH